MDNNCHNCQYYKTCKDRIEFDRFVRDFKQNSHANMIEDGLFLSGPSDDNIHIEYSVWCRYHKKEELSN